MEHTALQDRIQELEAANARRKSLGEAVATANANAAELMVALEEAKDEISARNRELQNILDNVRSGFLVADRDLVVSPVVTRSCQTLFGCTEVAETRMDALLGLDEDQAAEFKLSVEQVFDDLLPEELSLHQLPQRFLCAGKVLKLESTVTRDEDGDVEGILFSISDITQLEEEQKEVELSHALISILRQRDAFKGFVQEARSLLEAGRAALADSNEVVARRVLHTLKGMAGCYALTELRTLVHELESDELLADNAMQQVEECLHAFIHNNAELLQLTLEDIEDVNREYAIDDEAIAELVAAAERNDNAAVLAWVHNVRLLPVGSLLGPISELVQQVGRRYEKPVRLRVSGSELRVDEKVLGPILKQLPHLLQNAVANGIETAGERGDKPTQGSVQVDNSRTAESYQISVSDDGRGIDTTAVLAAAVKRGLLSEVEAKAMPEERALLLISKDGLSTAERIDTVAGRGVGLASVFGAVEAAGGQVAIENSPGTGSRFLLTVPARRGRPNEAPDSMVA